MPAGLENLPITVLMNAASGKDDKASSRAEIEAALRSSGRDVALFVAGRPRELPALAEQAARTRPGILVAAGGDGTLNTIAVVAWRSALPFGVIPLGTFNLFAREFGIPLDPAAAARSLIGGSIRPVPIGQVNDRIFLINASIGLYQRLIAQREAHKRRFGRHRLVALLSGLATLMLEHRPYQLHLELDGEPLVWSTPSVFFGRNALQMAQLGLDEAECVARGEMAVLALREVGRVELLGLALRGALARLETAENLRQHCALTVRLDLRRARSRSIHVAIDGEVVECALPLTVSVPPEPLQVVVPASPEGAA